MTRSLRLSLVALVLLAAAVLSSCGDSAGGTALTVNGTEVSQADVQAEIDDLVGFAEACPNSQFAQSLYGEGGDGTDTVSTAFTAQVLQERVVSIVVADEFASRDLEITQDDKDAAEEQFTSSLGGATCDPEAAADTSTSTTADPAQGQQIFDDFSQEFREFEITFNAQATVLGEALTAEAGEDLDVSDADVQAYYDENQDQFTQNCAAHILVADEATANDLKAQLDAGADFATLAEENSTDTGSAAQGGDLGCQAPGTFVPEFETAIDEAEVGKVTDPVQTEFGYHLILVNSKGVQPFEDVQDQIRTQLETPADDPLNAFLEESLGAAEVDVNQRYGSWDEDTLTVVPPEGPETPSTTLPDLGTAPADPATTDTTGG